MNQTDRRTRSYSMSYTPSRPLKNKQQLPQGTKVSIVYYLCSRNHHLDHPHFVEVPLASPNGLYLRDVIARLNAVRGRGMSAMYSWSCKRSYRNGFVWHDLEDDDLVIAAHGNEYILKGTELLDQSHSERLHHSPEPAHQEPHTFSSSSPTVSNKEAKPPRPRQEEELSPNFYRSGSSDNISPEPTTRSQAGSQGPIEYMVHKAGGWADASTQTVDNGGSRKCGPEKHMKGALIESEPLDIKFNESPRSPAPCFIRESEGGMAAMSPPAMSSSSSPLGVNMDTLESLIRDEVRRMNSFTIFDKEVLVPAKAKLKTTEMLVQLITCGSISMKDNNNSGLVRTYNPRLSNVSFPSPTFSSSMTMGEREFMSDKPTPNGLRQEEHKYLRGSIMKAKPHKEGGSERMPSLKLSSPCAKDRNAESHGSERKEQIIVDSAYTKCLRDKIKTSCKESRNETTMSPASDSRNSSARQDCNKSTPFGLSGGSKRITDTYSVEKSSTRLTSGALITIQSRAVSDV